MTAAVEGGQQSAARPGRTLPPGKTRYPFYRRLGGPQGRSGREENLVPTGIRSRTVQPVAQSLYRLSYPADIYIYIYIYTRTHAQTHTYTDRQTKLSTICSHGVIWAHNSSYTSLRLLSVGPADNSEAYFSAGRVKFLPFGLYTTYSALKHRNPWNM